VQLARWGNGRVGLLTVVGDAGPRLFRVPGPFGAAHRIVAWATRYPNAKDGSVIREFDQDGRFKNDLLQFGNSRAMQVQPDNANKMDRSNSDVARPQCQGIEEAEVKLNSKRRWQ
jgi:hypothetical protein